MKQKYLYSGPQTFFAASPGQEIQLCKGQTCDLEASDPRVKELLRLEYLTPIAAPISALQPISEASFASPLKKGDAS